MTGRPSELGESLGSSGSSGHSCSSSLGHSETTGKADSFSESVKAKGAIFRSSYQSRLSSYPPFSSTLSRSSLSSSPRPSSSSPNATSPLERPNHRSQLARVPLVKEHFVSRKNQGFYEHKQLQKQGGLPVPSIDSMLKEQDDELLRSESPHSAALPSQTSTSRNSRQSQSPSKSQSGNRANKALRG